jgi:hypothetical protein
MNLECFVDLAHPMCEENAFCYEGIESAQAQILKIRILRKLPVGLADRA